LQRAALALAFGGGSAFVGTAWSDDSFQQAVLWACGGFFLAVGLFACCLWAVGWGFTSDDDGIRLRRGRREEFATWGQIDDVTHHGFVGWSRLQLRHPDRSVIVPHVARTMDGSPAPWLWVRTDDGWRIVEAAKLARYVEPPLAERVVDGDWVRARAFSIPTARRGYAREPVEALLGRCAATLDALTSPAPPPPGFELVTPEDIERFEVGISRDGLDPSQVDELLERIAARLGELHDRRHGTEPA
jgi:hypothetical protein